MYKRKSASGENQRQMEKYPLSPRERSLEMRSVEVAMVVYSVCESECTEGHSKNCEPCTVFPEPYYVKHLGMRETKVSAETTV